MHEFLKNALEAALRDSEQFAIRKGTEYVEAEEESAQILAKALEQMDIKKPSDDVFAGMLAAIMFMTEIAPGDETFDMMLVGNGKMHEVLKQLFNGIAQAGTMALTSSMARIYDRREHGVLDDAQQT